jgi:hypothetical protein
MHNPPPVKPLGLTDELYKIVMDAARPLDVTLREPFLLAVARALASRNDLGPGVVHQTCRELQREFWDPPLSTYSHADKLAR